MNEPAERSIGHRLVILDKVDSTNTHAFQFADRPQHHGDAYLAREQTAGRGQYGRAWQAPPGSSVLMSVLVFPPLSLRRPALLTAWSAVAVCETILEVAKLHATIKWPNDVFVAGKKVCGILIEQRTTGNADFPIASVVGIGLNLNQTQDMFDQAALPDASSLGVLTQRQFAFDEVARTLLRRLDSHFQMLVGGDRTTLEAQWENRLGLVGKMVILEGIHQDYRGRLLGMALAGVELEVDGVVSRFVPESVKHLYPAPEPAR